mgnify:CR=1 FL=1
MVSSHSLMIDFLLLTFRPCFLLSFLSCSVVYQVYVFVYVFVFLLVHSSLFLFFFAIRNRVFNILLILLVCPVSAVHVGSIRPSKFVD